MPSDLGKLRLPRVIKRDGEQCEFDVSRIERAIRLAQDAVGATDPVTAHQLALNVARRFQGRQDPAHVEEIQDVVEEELMRAGCAEAARAYMLHRREHAALREVKAEIGVRDDLKLSVNAIRVLEARYLLKDEQGRVVESPSQMFRRVAKAIAAAENLYPDGDARQAEEVFYSMMTRLDFLPNSPTLMNAGTPMGQLSACFVLPIGDSLREIFGALTNMALIHQSGGGTGFAFTPIRPKGDVVRSTGGVASGPLSFMQIFDAATEVIKQGGRRRGANMGVLHVSHPDIQEFVTAKLESDKLRNFNLSVAVSRDFMDAVQRDDEYDLVNPRTGKVEKSLRARDLFDLITLSAWRCGDPGLIFIDEIEAANPTPSVGRIETTNPCGEQPLLPYESCILGSINLANMVREGDIDWLRLEKTVRAAVHFLDNVIDVNVFPLEEVRRATLANRKIGLGVMGFADMLIRLETPYDSEDALQIAERVMAFITKKATEKSEEIAASRGPFPNFGQSVWAEKGCPPRRNAALTTIAPTGTISLIAGVSSGIEPVFALCFFRNILGGARLFEEHRLFREAAEREGFYSPELMREVAHRGGVRSLPIAPEKIRRIFPTAMEIAPEWHVRMQAAFQKHTHNGVSKTVNLPSHAAPGDVARIFRLAYDLRCKGITVFRDGCKGEQVLESRAFAPSPEIPEVSATYSGECRKCVT